MLANGQPSVRSPCDSACGRLVLVPGRGSIRPSILQNQCGVSVTLNKLKSHLWNCAEILRGSAVDRTDWKAYILPLLFFKRICDVWDEETDEATELYGDADPVDFPEVHRFTVPEGCHWRDVRATPANVGAALSHAMRE